MEADPHTIDGRLTVWSMMSRRQGVALALMRHFVALAILAFGSQLASARVRFPSRQELQPLVSWPRLAAETRDCSGLFSQLASGACPFAQSDLTLKLKSVQLSGVQGINARDLGEAYRPLIGSTIRMSELCAIRDRVEGALLARNLLARVEIPEQSIDVGVVRLEVTRGRFESVRVTGHAPLARRVQAVLEHFTLLPHLDAEQRRLLLATDVPGTKSATL